MAVGNKISAARARMLQHQAQALALRRAGLSYAAIGRRLGVSKSRAHQLVHVGFEEARGQIVSSADDLLALELARLDGMLHVMYPRAAKGDLQACDRVLRICERRCKLLGLEAPVRIEATGRDGKAIEVSSSVTIYPSKLSSATLRELLDARIASPDGTR